MEATEAVENMENTHVLSSPIIDGSPSMQKPLRGLAASHYCWWRTTFVPSSAGDSHRLSR
jgi:hypothetical protein